MKHEPARWKADYERQGYLVIEDLVDHDTLAKLRQQIERITVDPDSLPAHLKRNLDMERDYSRRQPQYNDRSAKDIGNAIRNIMELPLFDPAFADLICYEPLLDVLEVLFGSTEFHFHNYKCIIKAPRVSSTFRWHRDLPYLYHSTPNLITAMLCLDPMTPENGATVVLPGTHRIPLEQVTDADQDIAEEKLPRDVPRVSVNCPAGSAVLFHVNIIHGGPANRSDIPRRNVIGIWAGPQTFPINPHRYAYQDVYPRSADPARQRQLHMSFPRLFADAPMAESN